MADDEQIIGRLIRRMHNREADPLMPLLDEYFIKRDSSENRYQQHTIPVVAAPRPGGRFSPSTICGCERQAAFKFLGVKGRKKVDTDLELVFEDGNWRHHKWQAIFRDMEAVLGPKKFKVLGIEQKVKVPDLYVSGSLDAALRLEGVKVVVDIKGINEFGFHRITQADEPVEHHVLQLICYCKARGIYKGLLLYDSKDKNRPRTFWVNFTPEMWDEVVEWCKSVIKKVEAEKLPPMSISCNAGSFDYEKCQFSHLCYGGKSDKQLRLLAYKNFVSVDDAWRRGQRVA